MDGAELQFHGIPPELTYLLNNGYVTYEGFFKIYSCPKNEKCKAFYGVLQSLRFPNEK